MTMIATDFAIRLEKPAVGVMVDNNCAESIENAKTVRLLAQTIQAVWLQGQMRGDCLSCGQVLAFAKRSLPDLPTALRAA
jgi:hypothetical protein